MLPTILAQSQFSYSGLALSLLVLLFLVVSVAMILIVLVQRPQGGGLSGAFGAASEGAGQTAFGARTGDALTTATIIIFVVFIGVSIGLNYAIRPAEGQTLDPLTGEAAEQTTEDAPQDVTEAGLDAPADNPDELANQMEVPVVVPPAPTQPPASQEDAAP